MPGGRCGARRAGRTSTTRTFARPITSATSSGSASRTRSVTWSGRPSSASRAGLRRPSGRSVWQQTLAAPGPPRTT
eukprot:9144126-Lingulodinium_polyedra.AAC.1